MAAVGGLPVLRQQGRDGDLHHGDGESAALPRPVYRLLVHDRLGQLVGERGGREVEQEGGWKIRRY